MTAPPAPLPDAPALAAEVRQLALLAHRLLNDPSAPDDDRLDLSRRLNRLRRQVRAGRASGSVSRWLDRLDQRLEAEPAFASR